MEFPVDIKINHIEDKNDKIEFIKKHVNEIVCKLHNPSIIDPKLQPNENIIYYLYSDGTVTRQKGGWAYGRRTVTDVMSKIIQSNNFFTFPLKGDFVGDTYAIILYEDCLKIRQLVSNLMSQI